MAADPRDGESDEARPAGDGDLQLRPDATAGDPTAPPVELPPPRTFWTELRSRKVVQVTVSYAVLAWLLVQIASVVLPAFDAPGWAMRLTIFLLALGLPVALVLSWAFDIGAHGIRRVPGRGGNLRIGVAAASLAAVAVGWFVFGQQALDQAITAEERSVAVLPFVNVGGERGNEYLSDGLAETTLDMLAQVGDLKVIARTSSFAFKGRDVDAREIGRSLGAAHLLEGSVQRAGDMLRITAQLVRASDGSRLWSRRFDRPMADVFAVQDEIATEVVGALQAALPGDEQRRMRAQAGGGDIGAYDEVLKGLALLPGERVPDLEQALRHFDAAIAREPGNVRAHVAAARTMRTLAMLGAGVEGGNVRWARYIGRALELDPESGEALGEEAARLFIGGEADAAFERFDRALALAPGNAVLLDLYARALFFGGRAQESMAMFRRAVALDPASPGLRRDYASLLAEMGRMREAEGEIDALLQVHPRLASGLQLKAQLRSLQGDLAGALRAVDAAIAADPANADVDSTRCFLLAAHGAYDAMRGCTGQFVTMHPGSHLVDPLLGWVAAREGRIDDFVARAATLDDEDTATRSLALYDAGRYAEAAELLQGFRPGLFADPPQTDDLMLPDLVQGGAIMAAAGMPAGRRVLDAAVARARATDHGSTLHTRYWWEAIALGHLGRVPEACAAIDAAVEGGLKVDLFELELPPTLAKLRAAPCYAASVEPVVAGNRRAIGEAQAAGLL